MSAIVPQPMSLVRAIRHLCASDLRRFHWLVNGVVGIELVRASLVEGSVHLAPATARSGLGPAGAEMAIPLLDFGIVVMTALVTAILVQADHPTDDRAFWRTRPIPPIAMAGAKLLSMTLLFVVVPSAINAIRLAAYGAPAGAIAAATVQIAVLAGVVCVPAWFIAVIARTLPRFLGTVFGVMIGAYFLMGFMAMIVGFQTRGVVRPGLGVVPGILDWQHTGIHGWWGGLISTVAGLAILAAHYATRRMKATVAALLLLVLIPSLVPAVDPDQPAPADLAHRVDGGLTLPEGLFAMSSSRSSEFGETTVHVTGPIGSPPLPEDVSASIRLDRLALRAGGKPVPAEGREQCCLGRGAIGVVSAAAARRAAAEYQTQPLSYARSSPRAYSNYNAKFQVFDVRASLVDALRGGPIDVDANVAVDFVRHQVAGALPLRPGESLRTDRYLLEVLAVESLGDRPVDPRTQSWVLQVLVRFTRFPTMAVSSPRLDFFTADRARTRADFVWAPWPIATYNAGTTVDNFAIGRRWAGRFPMRIESRTPRPADSDLVVVESTALGTLRTRLAAASVPIAVPSKTPY